MKTKKAKKIKKVNKTQKQMVIAMVHTIKMLMKTPVQVELVNQKNQVIKQKMVIISQATLQEEIKTLIKIAKYI